MPITGLRLRCVQVLLGQRSFLLLARSDDTTGRRNIKPEIVLKVQKMAQYASFCLITGPFKGKSLGFRWRFHLFALFVVHTFHTVSQRQISWSIDCLILFAIYIASLHSAVGLSVRKSVSCQNGWVDPDDIGDTCLCFCVLVMSWAGFYHFIQVLCYRSRHYWTKNCHICNFCKHGKCLKSKCWVQLNCLL